MVNSLNLIPTLACFALLSCSKTTPSIENEAVGEVLKVGQELVFEKDGFKGRIYALSANKRVFTYGGKTFTFRVTPRVEPLGGGSLTFGKQGVYAAGESFYPHSSVSIVYDEHIKRFKSKFLLIEDFKSGVDKSKKSSNYILSNEGYRIFLTGSLQSGRISVNLAKLEFPEDQPKFDDALPGSIFLLTKNGPSKGFSREGRRGQ